MTIRSGAWILDLCHFKGTGTTLSPTINLCLIYVLNCRGKLITNNKVRESSCHKLAATS